MLHMAVNAEGTYNGKGRKDVIYFGPDNRTAVQ